MSTDYQTWLGKKVYKQRINPACAPKPFKSGQRFNTVKEIINHPQLNIPAFTFVEDDSYVACRTCQLVDE